MTKSCLIFSPPRFDGQILVARDFSSAVSCFGCMLITRNKKETSDTQVICSGETLRLFMKQDFFGEEIIHENSLRLSYF